jgi:hypothetical protein
VSARTEHFPLMRLESDEALYGRLSTFELLGIQKRLEALSKTEAPALIRYALVSDELERRNQPEHLRYDR